MQQCVTGSQKSGADFFVLKKFIDFVLLTSHQKHRKNCSWSCTYFFLKIGCAWSVRSFVELEIQVLFSLKARKKNQVHQYVSSEYVDKFHSSEWSAQNRPSKEAIERWSPGYTRLLMQCTWREVGQRTLRKYYKISTPGTLREMGIMWECTLCGRTWPLLWQRRSGDGYVCVSLHDWMFSHYLFSKVETASNKALFYGTREEVMMGMSYSLHNQMVFLLPSGNCMGVA